MRYSYPSAFTRALIYVGGVPIQLFANHLDYYDTGVRTRELTDLMNWARSFSGTKLIGGDFNSWWGEWWILQMETEYSDTWRDYTGSNANGYTTGNVRFDYLFRSFDGAGHLTPLGASVPWTALSDHRPVVGDYSVQ
jgi:endonuclease/exonuclease/phosphatase (EEP) superfamily protein YafD